MTEKNELTYLELRIRAREQIKTGALPSVAPEDLSAGYGSSLNSCVLCGRSIASTEVEYEVCVTERRLNFHVACYAAWRDECLHKLHDNALRAAPTSAFAIRHWMVR